MLPFETLFISVLKTRQGTFVALETLFSISDKMNKRAETNKDLLLFEALFIFVLKTWQGRLLLFETLFIFVLKT